MPMNIVHITTIHNRYDNRIFWKQCKSLAIDGFNVTLIVNDDKDDEIREGVNIISVRHKNNNLLFRLLALPKFIKKARELSPDIVHFHDPETLLIAGNLKKIAKKVIFDSHEYYKYQILAKPYIPRAFRQLTSFAYSFIENAAIKRINGVILPCTFDGVNPFDNIAARTEIISNKPRKITTKQNETKRYDMVYVGSITVHRGVMKYIDLAIKTSDSLLLVGQIIDSVLKSKIELLTETNTNITLIDWVDPSLLDAYLSQSKIGLCLIEDVGQYHIADSLPTKVYDYLSWNIPVLLNKGNFNNQLFHETSYVKLVDYNDFNDVLSGYLELKSQVEMNQIDSKDIIEFLSNNSWELEYSKLKSFYLSI